MSFGICTLSVLRKYARILIQRIFKLPFVIVHVEADCDRNLSAKRSKVKQHTLSRLVVRFFLQHHNLYGLFANLESVYWLRACRIGCVFSLSLTEPRLPWASVGARALHPEVQVSDSRQRYGVHSEILLLLWLQHHHSDVGLWALTPPTAYGRLLSRQADAVPRTL